MKRFRSHLLVLALLGVVWLTAAHEPLRNALFDFRLNWFPRQASGEIVLVAVDSTSIQKVGTWPWPRSLHATLLERLEVAGAAEIAFDIDFSSPSNVRDDESFLAALHKASGSVILPAFMQWLGHSEAEQELHLNRPLPRFSEQAWTGIVNVTADRDGLVRRYPYGAMVEGSPIPSMAALLAGTGTLGSEAFWVDYSIDPTSVPVVSYVDILQAEPSALQKLRGKRILIGGTALELGDRFTVPQGRIISGPMLQLLAAESILQARDLRRLSDIVALGGIVLVGLCIFALRRHSQFARWVIALLTAAMTFEFGATYLQATAPLILDTSLFHIAVAGYLLCFAVEEIDFRGMLSRVGERRFEHITMSLGEGLLCTDRSGRVSLCNPAAAQILGYNFHEVTGRTVDQLFETAGHNEAGSFIKQLEKQQPKSGNTFELTGVRSDGTRFPAEISISKWEGVEEVQYGFIVRDISTRKREAERMRRLAEYDTLTNLANRHLLQQQLKIELAEATQQRRKLALLLIDLDKFKEINDTFGHTYGDRVLAAVAGHLQTFAAAGNLVARLGGDEFAIVISCGNVEEEAKRLARQITEKLSDASIVVEDRRLWVNASVGISYFPDHGGTADELFSNADLALYRAKANGRGQSIVFERELRDLFERRLALEEELKVAVEDKHFELFYQPQVELRNGKLVGAEALIRWRHPRRGLISPAEFMPVINASSLAGDVGKWVLASACRQARIWQDQGHNIRVAVNLSPCQLRSGSLAAEVGEVLKATELSPHLLELEVTEDIVLADEDSALSNFRQLQDIGVRMAFDDFGTGYAGLSYLKKFSFDVLKIDRSFVAGLCTSADDMAIVAGTIAMSKQLGLTVIAEGIEDLATAEALRSLSCEEGQGYLYGRPMPAPEFERKVWSGNREPVLVPGCATEAA